MTYDLDTFITALLDPGKPTPGDLIDAATRPVGRRFDVYRNNVVVSLTDAMRVGFPVITKLVGQQNMDGLAGLFLRAHPPSDPRMMHYGTAFPEFLADNAQVAHLGYLEDVARLELAIRHAYHAGDAEPIAPQTLSDIATGALMQSTLTLAPAVQLIRSGWPIHDIWRFNTDDTAAKPQPGAQDVLITRPEFDPQPHLLPPGGAAWIAGVMDGQTIGAAFDSARAEWPDFDLTAPLTLLLAGCAITSLNQKDRS